MVMTTLEDHLTRGNGDNKTTTTGLQAIITTMEIARNLAEVVQVSSLIST